jgi:16S rRNA C967 or C1407 C5-methylase (RsmB/RsmF family)
LQGRRPGRGRNKGRGGRKSKRRDSKKNMTPEDRVNKNFEAYYMAQPALLGQHECKSFLSTLQRPLPSTFRVNPVNLLKHDVLHRLNNEFMYELGDVIVDGAFLPPPRPLAWFPDNGAWQLGCSVKKLRRTPSLKPLHSFIVQETEAGNISRQEAVSMLPPIMLSVESHHKVLDMCAAPGSKTGQLLESLHLGTLKTGVPPTGFVVANDADAQRAYMLTHQVKRIGSAGMLITTHMGQYFPDVTLGGTDGKLAAKQARRNESEESSSSSSSSSGTGTAAAAPQLRYPKGTFDRILADVPCSGDGTLRKNCEIWNSWTLTSGVQLHPLQTQIAMRGLALLKVGGLMVYSTCSFNPVENEAVVASIIRRCRGAVELVDTSAMLPKLVRRPGLHTWKMAVEHPQSELDKEVGAAVPIASPELDAATAAAPDSAADPSTASNGKKQPVKMGIKFVSSMDEVPDHINGTGFDFKKHLRPDMFPPSAEDAARMHLEYCWRMMPHDQNTGGFFLALLRKTGELQGPEGPRKTPAPEKSVKKEKDAAEDDDVVMEDDAAADEPSAVAEPAVAEPADVAADVSGVPRGMVSAGNKTGSAVKGRAKSYMLPVLREGGHDMYNKWVVGDENEKIWAQVKEHFGIKDSFDPSQLYTRSANAKIISYVNKAVADTCMDFTNNVRKLKIVNAGLRMFEKAREKASERVATKSGVVGKACPYRLNHESLHLIEPYMTKRKVLCSMEDMEKVLANPKTCNPDTLSKETADQIAKISIGSCVFVFELPHADDVASAAARKTVVVWRGEKYLNIMVRKQDAESLLFVVRRLLGIESKPRQGFHDAQDKLKADQAAAAAAAEAGETSSSSQAVPPAAPAAAAAAPIQ